MKRNNTFGTLVLGNVICLIGSALLSTTPVSLDVPKILYGYQVISGFGAGLIFCCSTIMISLNAEFRDHAIAQGINAQVRVLGGTIGIAMSTILFGNNVSSLGKVLSPVEISTLYRNPAFISRLKPLGQLYMREAFAHTFNKSLRICTFIGVASTLISLFAYQRDPPSMEKRKQDLENALADTANRRLVELRTEEMTKTIG